MLFLVLLLYLSQCHVLSLWHAEVSKDQHKEDHTRVDPEEAMKPNGVNDVSRCLDGSKRRDHLKAKDDATAKASQLRWKHFTLKNNRYCAVPKRKSNINEDDEDEWKYLPCVRKIV